MGEKMQTGGVLVLMQEHRGRIHPISLELAGYATHFATEHGLEARGVLVTEGLTQVAKTQLEGCGLEAVGVYEMPNLTGFIPEVYCGILLEPLRLLRPEILLVGATPEGRALAPMLAVCLGTGVTADCTSLEIGGGLLVQTRPAFGGDLMAKIVTPDARPQMATVRYGVLKSALLAQGRTEIVLQTPKFAPTIAGMTAEWLEEPTEETSDSAVTIAVGGGLRAREDIELFRELCKKIDAKLMCSRSLVERGWLPQSCQIGLSGQSVSSRLLIAFGVSGSVQFRAGIQNVGALCAVNNDTAAPLLKCADIPLLGDLYEVASSLQGMLA